MKLVETLAEARDLRSGVTGLVPTMGYFHEGHLSLMSAARAECDTVLVSLFVNPLQFGPGEDLDRYPRDLERDSQLAEAEGVDVLFAPALREMYPDQPRTRVSVASLASGLSGRARPGHFEGMATVVAKLFAGLQAERAYLGRKDAQQLAVVRRMAADLSFPIEVIGCPIVREQDGLALSSRNVYLSPEERRAATALSRGLMLASDAAAAGETSGAALEEAAMAEMGAEPLVEPEYAELTEAEEVTRLPRLDRPCFLEVAARVGSARLIDNVHFLPHDDLLMPDRGVRLSAPSLLYREVS
ncbi:MAG: pantoate--beta-alanine ligase [Acidimicrobiia bacterium]